MDPKDLPPLRSGLGRLGGQLMESTTTGDDGEAMRKRLIAAVVVMTRRAAERAVTWSAHDGRDSASEADVEIALKHQARYFLGTLDDPDVVQDILDTEHELFGDDESEEEEEGKEEDSEGEEEEEEEEEKTKCPCACDFCVEMREASETWDAWNPHDEIEQYLKTRVDAAVKTVKNSQLCLEMEI